jgi:hypothetical protein
MELNEAIKSANTRKRSEDASSQRDAALLCEVFDDLCRGHDAGETFAQDHQLRFLQVHVIRRSSVAQDHHLEAAFIALTCSRTAAEVGKGSTNHDGVAVQVLQNRLKRRVKESAVRPFVYDHFILCRRQLVTNRPIAKPLGIVRDARKAIWHVGAA